MGLLPSQVKWPDTGGLGYTPWLGSKPPSAAISRFGVCLVSEEYGCVFLQGAPKMVVFLLVFLKNYQTLVSSKKETPTCMYNFFLRSLVLLQVVWEAHFGGKHQVSTTSDQAIWK